MNRLTPEQIAVIAAEVHEDYLAAVAEVRRVGEILDEESRRRAQRLIEAHL